MPKLTLSNDKRVGCLGRTGVGKTFLMEKLLAPQPRVIVVDHKHRVNFPGYHLTDDPRAALIHPKTIYSPGESGVPGSFWIAAMDVLHEAGGGIIYVDEMAEATTANSAPKGLLTVLRLGREIGVSIWWAAQEATAVHNTVLRQSDVLLLFLNIGASDRDKIIKTTGDMGEATADLGFYEFMVFNSSGESYDSSSNPLNKYAAKNMALKLGILSPIRPPNINLGGGNHTSSDSGTAANVGPVHVGGTDAVRVTGGTKAVQQWAALAIAAGRSVTPNIPPNVLLGQIQVESGGNINAISSAGAFGLTQFIRSTADSYGVKPGDARSQIYGQAHYLHDLGYKPGNEARAIGMYNPLNGKPNVAYANSVIAASKLYTVTGGGTSPTVGVSTGSVGEAWAAIKTLVSVFVNPVNLGKLIARSYAFFYKLIFRAIWDVLIAPLWHWVQRAVDYYFNQIMSGKAQSGYYYNMAGIVTLFFWAIGYGILWGKAEDGPARADSPRDTMLGRAIRTGQNVFAARNVVKPKDVAAKTKKKPDPVVSETPVVETRRVSVSRRRPVRVVGTDNSTNKEGTSTDASTEASTSDEASEPSEQSPEQG